MSQISRLFRFLGSGPVAVVLIAIWAIVLTVATFYEARTTSGAVSTLVYRSWWFAALLVVIAINVTVAALRRWPWQWRHAGFLVTHLAIDLLLLGGLLTVAWGIDGNVKLAEGSGTDRGLLEGMTLQVDSGQSAPLRAGASLKLADGTTLQVTQVLPAAQKKLAVKPDGAADQPALHFILSNDQTRVDEWLVAREKLLARRNFGPLTASLTEVKELPRIDQSPRITVEVAGTKANIPIETLEDKQYPVGSTPYKVRVLQRFERAMVDGRTIAEKPTGTPNPAVRVEIEGPKGKEIHVAFARFPDFPSLHGRGQSAMGAQVRYLSGQVSGGEMHFFWLPDRKVYLQYEGNYLPVRTGENLPTAFKGMKLTVDQVVDRAQVVSSYVQAADGPMAALVSAGKDQAWVATDAPGTLAGHTLKLANESFPLGFTIKLDKFTIKTDPGSSRPAAFISDVTVVDGQRTSTARIEMNQPLHYGGFSFYQSGYQTGESGPAISILQVAKDPGIGAKYVGTFLLILGIFWAFYVEPAQARRRGAPAAPAVLPGLALALLLLSALSAPAMAAPADSPTSAPATAPSGQPTVTPPHGMPGSPHGEASVAPSGKMPSGHPPMMPPHGMPKGMPGSPHGDASGVPAGTMPSGMPGMPGGHGKMPPGHGGQGGFHGGEPNQDPFGGKAPPIPEVNPVSLAEARRLAVQDRGRVRPLDSFAREMVMTVTGRDKLAGRDPVEVVLSWVTLGAMWSQQAIIYVPDQELKKTLGLDVDQPRFAPSLLATHKALLGLVQGAHGKQNPSSLEREALLVMQRVELAQAILQGHVMAIVPPSADPAATWLAPADLSAMDSATSALVIEFFKAFDDKDSTRFAKAAVALENALRTKGGAAYPSQALLDMELLYNRIRPFRTAWYLLVAALVLFGLGSMWGGLRYLGVGMAVASLLLQTAGLGMRTYISQRAPVTNMYESVVLVAWGALAFGLVMAWKYRGHTLAVAAMILSACTLVLADSVPTVLDPTIQPLTPVLRSNFWLTVHVITITLSYAAFALAMVLGHGWLVLNCRQDTERKRADLIRFLLANLRVGVLLLAAGTLLGGVWANYSWGRFWGWDPKEVWALIALLGYVGVLHASYTGWISDRGLAVGSIGGFLGVVMAWYGVNYILGSGLHSYGFGSGGATWTAFYAGFEAIFVVVMVLAGASPAAPPADATSEPTTPSPAEA